MGCKKYISVVGRYRAMYTKLFIIPSCKTVNLKAFSHYIRGVMLETDKIDWDKREVTVVCQNPLIGSLYRLPLLKMQAYLKNWQLKQKFPCKQKIKGK